MSTKDPFIEWLRGKIGENLQDPPAESWEEISDALDLEESWEQIGEELELRDVWNKVDTRLRRFESLEKIEKWTNRLSAAAVLLLFSGIFLHNSLIDAPALEQEIKSEKYTYDQNLESIKERLYPIEEEVVGLNSTVKSTIEDEKENIKKAATLIGKDKGAAEVPPGQKDEFISGTVVVKKEEKINNGLPLEGVLKVVPFAEKTGYLWEQLGPLTFDSLKKLQVLPLDEMSRMDFKYPEIYVGAGSAFKVSWFMNNKTSYALEKSSLLTAAPAYQNDYYFFLGSHLNDRFLLQADLYWQDKIGQVFQEYRNGHYGKVKDELRYRSAALNISYLKRKLSYGKYMHFSRLLAGIYGGRLLKAEERVEGVSVEKTSEYARYHMGLLAGYELDTFLSDRLIFTYGMRSRLDLLNIYAGTSYMPAAFGRTRAISLDFTLSLKYVLKK